jgi:hypothetical protein
MSRVDYGGTCPPRTVHSAQSTMNINSKAPTRQPGKHSGGRVVASECVDGTASASEGRSVRWRRRTCPPVPSACWAGSFRRRFEWTLVLGGVAVACGGGTTNGGTASLTGSTGPAATGGTSAAGAQTGDARGYVARPNACPACASSRVRPSPDGPPVPTSPET